uniref:Mitogen-activated protein kinase-binding protein 1 n=1 Tax=Plectus sambesii TaxID=2011161 RepID=A0A914WB24_9BILA
YGHEPCVRVWELYDKNQQWVGTPVTELKNHQLGIACVRFSPNGQQLVSVGNPHDKSIVVWDWRAGKKMAENRLTSQVNAMAVNETGAVFVTVGVRHVKFWYTNVARPKAGFDTSVAPLQGRSAILSDQRNNTFVDVVCGKGKLADRTFAVTETRLLVEFHDKKLICSYDLHATAPYSITLGAGHLYVGCANGIIRVMTLDPVQHAMTVVKPHCLGVDVAEGQSPDHLMKHPSNAKYPDVRALCFDEQSKTLTAAYADRSLYQWSFAVKGKITKNASQLFHVGPIYGVEAYPAAGSWLPAGSFLTCGADETVRVWNIDSKPETIQPSSLPRQNIYSRELMKILYLGANLETALCDTTDRANGSLSMDGRADSMTTNIGIKALRVSPDGTHLATGSRDGNIRIFDLTSQGLAELSYFEAHDGDVLCLEYSDPRKGARFLLASGSRDRLIHLYDPLNRYTPLTTVDDHSSAIISIKFTMNTEGLEMFTCAADKLVVIRRLATDTNEIRFDRINQMTSQFGLYDMQMSPEGAILAACQDRQIRAFSLQGKLVRTVKGTIGEDGILTKMALDPSGSFAATVCSDKSVYVVDAASGDCVAVLAGQSDAVSSVTFTPDCRRLIVVSCSGCVFIWRLSSHLTQRMHANLKKLQQGNFRSSAGDRPLTPDSVIESGSDGASEDLSIDNRSSEAVRGVGDGATMPGKDSESEFGSLTSVRLADDDTDSISNRQSVVVNEIDADRSTDASQFEIKRLPTEVIRRSNSGLVRSPNSSWDMSKTADDLSDDEEAASARMSGGWSNSRSMSNLRATSATSGDIRSPRRQRKRWDVVEKSPSNDLSAFTSPTKSGNTSYATNFDEYDDLNEANMASFNRRSPQRISLTQRFLRTSDQPSDRPDQRPSPVFPQGMRPVWTPSPKSLANIRGQDGGAPYGMASSMYSRRPSDISMTSMYTSSAPSTVDSRVIMRAKALNRLKHRRMTVASMEQVEEDDYSSSDLHLRSRSQSPSQLALNGDRRVRQDSDMSTNSTLTMRSSRLTPASSRQNLRFIGGSNRPQAATLRKLSDVRDKLRKSQENLAFSTGDDSYGDSSMSRSKSISNLRNGPSHSASASALRPLLPTAASALIKSRELAKSVGSLHRAAVAANGNYEPKPLSQTIKDLKRASNHDLTADQDDKGVFGDDYDESFATAPNGVSPYYNTASLPRRKGAVQKRVERYQPRYRSRVDQASASGESDSNASDANSPLSPMKNSRRYFATNSPAARSASSVEVGLPRPGTLQNTRRIFESPVTPRASPPVATRRSTNYLAQKLAGHPSDLVSGPDISSTSEDSPRSLQETLMADFGNKEPQAKPVAVDGLGATELHPCWALGDLSQHTPMTGRESPRSRPVSPPRDEAGDCPAVRPPIVTPLLSLLIPSVGGRLSAAAAAVLSS